MADPKLEVVTEIGVFGSLNIEDPTTLKVAKETDLLDVDKEAATEEVDMDELAKKILNS